MNMKIYFEYEIMNSIFKRADKYLKHCKIPKGDNVMFL